MAAHFKKLRLHHSMSSNIPIQTSEKTTDTMKPFPVVKQRPFGVLFPQLFVSSVVMRSPLSLSRIKLGVNFWMFHIL